MIVKKIETFLRDNVLNVSILLQSYKTDVRRYIDLEELAKINIGDDIKVQNNKIQIIKKNNKMKYLLSTNCPSCGNPLTPIFKDKEKKKVAKYVCENLYGCAGQRENLITKWCAFYKISSLLPRITEFLKYFSLDSFILDRTKKMAIEKVIPMLYVINKEDMLRWIKDEKIADKIINEIQGTKNKVKLMDIFILFPNDFTKEEIAYLLKEYKTIENLFNVSERDRIELAKKMQKDSIMKLYAFVDKHRDTIKLLEENKVNLTNK